MFAFPSDAVSRDLPRPRTAEPLESMRRLLPPLLVALSVGCGVGAEPPQRVWRFIESAPRFVLSAADLLEVRCALHMSFPDGREGEGARLVAGERIAGLGAGLKVRGGSGAPTLRVTRAVEPAEVDSARLTIGGLRRGEVRVRWRAADDSAEGSVVLPKSVGSGANRDRFLVDLADAAASGSRFVLEIEPTSVAGEIVTVGEICIGRREASAEQLATAAAVPWKVTLDDETRDVLLFPAGGVVASEGTLPLRPRLEVGVGKLSGSVERLEIVAEVVGDSGRLNAGRTILSGEALDRGWSDLSFDLPGGESEPVRVEISIQPIGGHGDQVFVASSPRIVGTGATDDRPNIVLVSLDTLAAGHLSLYGYERLTSPNLDRWAVDHGTVFERAVTPASWTLPAHFSLFTGVEAFAHPANYNSIAIDTSAYRFLAEELWSAGYRTVAITGGSYLSPDYGLSRGFETFRAWRSKEQREEELEDHLARALDFLRQDHSQPFFLFFHTYEVHTPNGAREPWFTAFHGGADDRIVDLGPPEPADAEAGFLGSRSFVLRRRQGDRVERVGPDSASLPVDAYDSAIAYLDDQMLPLLEELSGPTLGDRTVVAIVADHGESLEGEGRAGHTYLSWDNLHVPLVLAGPARLVPRKRIQDQVRLHDLYPTLLEIAGSAPVASVDGRSLRPLLLGERDPPRYAFVYAAPTNRGLAAVAPDGLKFHWNNSAWTPLAGQQQWWRVEGLYERALAGAPVGSESNRLRSLLESGYVAAAPGLRIELGTESTEPMTFELGSDSIDPVTVKATSTDSPGLRWTDVGRLRGEISVDRTLRISLERLASRGAALVIHVRHARCREAAMTTIVGSPERLRDERVVELRPSGCQVDFAPSARLQVSWRGPAPDSAWQPADQALQDELRALGYLH